MGARKNDNPGRTKPTKSTKQGSWELTDTKTATMEPGWVCVSWHICYCCWLAVLWGLLTVWVRCLWLFHLLLRYFFLLLDCLTQPWKLRWIYSAHTINTCTGSPDKDFVMPLNLIPVKVLPLLHGSEALRSLTWPVHINIHIHSGFHPLRDFSVLHNLF